MISYLKKSLEKSLKTLKNFVSHTYNLWLWPQVAQARYMSSSMLTFALLRDSSDLHVYEDLFGERNKPEKKRKITVELH